MKKVFRNFVVVGLASVMLLQSSCMGSFKLTRNVYDWNSSSNSIFNHLIFWILAAAQVYSVLLFIDVFIFNVIEFWDGSNPLSMKEGETEKKLVMDKNGNQVLMTATKNKLEAEYVSGPQKGEKSALEYKSNEKSWYSISKKETRKVLSFIGKNDETVVVYTNTGEEKYFKNSDLGMLDIKNVSSLAFN